MAELVEIVTIADGQTESTAFRVVGRAITGIKADASVGAVKIQDASESTGSYTDVSSLTTLTLDTGLTDINYRLSLGMLYGKIVATGGAVTGDKKIEIRMIQTI